MVDFFFFFFFIDAANYHSLLFGANPYCLLIAFHFIFPSESAHTINARPHLEADGASNHISAQYLTGSNLIKGNTMQEPD